jgi:glycosyltransferase involved in cell wall biosynthesis
LPKKGKEIYPERNYTPPGIQKMSDSLITMIIPTYRRPKLLKRAISSALNQTYPHIQVQIYDNASGDETEQIVRNFIEKDSRVKYHCHPENIGMLGNYRYGLSEVKTPYFSFLSDDDVLLPWFYEEALHGFQQFPECAFSAASTIIMSEEGKIIRVPLDLWGKEGYLEPPEGLFEMISKYPVPTCILFHRKYINKISIDMDNPLAWDCDFLIQIAAQYPIFVSKRPCGIFLSHKSSYSNSKKLEEWDSSWNKLIKRLNNNSDFSQEIKNNAVALINQELRILSKAFILQALFCRKFEAACRYATISWKNHGLTVETLFFLVLTTCCRWVPLFISILILMRKLKRVIKKDSHRTYEEYAKWLEGECFCKEIQDLFVREF